jgi:uncharacterized membrane protein YoaK (UPF0700 family)
LKSQRGLVIGNDEGFADVSAGRRTLRAGVHSVDRLPDDPSRRGDRSSEPSTKYLLHLKMSEIVTKKAKPSLATPLAGTASWYRGAPIPSVDDTLAIKLLPLVLSFIAGSVDVIGFLRLDGLLTAHITGNLVILAAHIVAGGEASLALIISVPVFILALATTRVLVAGLERARIAPLQPLLLLQFALLCAFLGIAVIEGDDVNPHAPSMILAGMLGVSAMAVQNGLVRLALTGSPSTAVLTTNITLLITDIGEILLGHGADHRTKASKRARHTWPVILGFLLGCALGAACEAALGLWSLVLPTGFALVAFALSVVPPSSARE